MGAQFVFISGLSSPSLSRSLSIPPVNHFLIQTSDLPWSGFFFGGGEGALKCTSPGPQVVYVRHCKFHTRCTTQCDEPKLPTAVSLSRHLSRLLRLSDRPYDTHTGAAAQSSPRADLVKADHVGAVPEFAAPIRTLKTTSLTCPSRLRQVFLDSVLDLKKKVFWSPIIRESNI